MQLGGFSVGLAVADLAASMEFYGKLGFTQYAGNPEQNWVIMKNGDTNIGLFKGILEKNVLLFNPGWNQAAEPLDSFKDVRELQRQLKAQGVALASEADEETTGPASCIVLDPDGNPVYLDQHV
jgi:catechol 2,3-dioxygenase-like lactoylglutathione lyase family enzyme